MSKGEATKTSILDEALHVASRVGFEGLSIGQLAERTDMSKSGLFAHFRSKEQLQLQTLDHAAPGSPTSSCARRSRLPAVRRRVRELFERWLDWETETLAGGCVFATASIEYDDQPGPMHDSLVRQQRDWTEFIATVAGTAVSEGEFRADLDTQQFAFTLQGLMFGYRHARPAARATPTRSTAPAPPSSSCSTRPARPTTTLPGETSCHVHRKARSFVFSTWRVGRRSGRPTSSRPASPAGSPATCGSRSRPGWPPTRLPGGGEAFEVESLGAAVRGHVWGAGPVVYLVHGWGGRGPSSRRSSSRSWRKASAS